MKKGLKYILISGAVTLLVGLGLVIAGVAAGASWYDVGNVVFSNKYSIGDSAIWGIGITKEAKGNKLDSESKILQDIDVKTIKKLTINMAAGTLDIKEGQSEYFQVNNNEKRGDCYIGHNGDEVTVTIIGENGNSRGAKTTFWIPQGLEVADLEIYVDAGKVRTEDLNATALTISVGAGQVQADAIKATDLDIIVDVGEFKNSGKIIADKATLKVAAGNLKVDLLEANSARVNVDIGHLDVEFVGEQSDYNIEAECDLGEIKIGNEKHHMGKEHKLHNSGVDKSIEVECNIGQAIIDFEN